MVSFGMIQDEEVRAASWEARFLDLFGMIREPEVGSFLLLPRGEEEYTGGGSYFVDSSQIRE